VHSLTKRRLNAGEIAALIRHGAGPNAEVHAYSEVTDGFFNAVYAVALADGRELVLKVAPDPDVKLLRYEVDLMHTEVEFFRRAQEVGVPVPVVVAAEPESGYLLMRRLEGRPLQVAKETMTAAELESVRRELGMICARLGQVTGSTFGYPRKDGRSQSPSWRTSFLTMIDDILADAVEYRRELPAPLLVGFANPAHVDLRDIVHTVGWPRRLGADD
jgi:aminoglycoside phosphotransferase (APT) family kinase protein